jgi:hypothetical protein
MALPGELRNKIYEECLKDCNINQHGEYEECLWLRSKQKRYHRTVERVNLTSDYWEENSKYSNHSLCCNSSRRGVRAFDPRNPGTKDEQTTLVPNILAVSKQIYQEAMPILYGQRMVFADVTALAAFAAKLSGNAASHIRNVEIRCWNQTVSRRNMPFTAMVLLAAKGATNLQTLQINCRVGYMYFGQYYNRYPFSSRPVKSEDEIPKMYARRVYRACYPLLEAMGYAKPEDSQQCSWYRGIDVIRFGEHIFQDWFDVRSRSVSGLKSKTVHEADLDAKKELRKLMKTPA